MKKPTFTMGIVTSTNLLNTNRLRRNSTIPLTLINGLHILYDHHVSRFVSHNLRQIGLHELIPATDSLFNRQAKRVRRRRSIR